MRLTISRSQIGRSQGVSARAANMKIPAMIAALTPSDALGDANLPGSPRHRSIPHRPNRASEAVTYPGTKASGSVQKRCRPRLLKCFLVTLFIVHRDRCGEAGSVSAVVSGGGSGGGLPSAHSTFCDASVASQLGSNFSESTECPSQYRHGPDSGRRHVYQHGPPDCLRFRPPAPRP